MIAVVGEALVDVITTPDQVRRYPGGSPANVAVGLARLGVDVGLLTQFGRDGNGDLIATHLADSGVRLLAPPGRKPTSVAAATIAADGVAQYEFDIAWTLDELTTSTTSALASAACVHVGSISATLPPGAATVRSVVNQVRAGATISYDPNCRPLLMGDVAGARASIEALVGGSDIVKVSDEDLRWLYPDRLADDIAARWLASGPALVIVTRAANGASARTARRTVAIDAADADVVDTIGAGDSFMAAILAGLADRELLGAGRRDQLARIERTSLIQLLDFAAQAAAITCERAGADPPTRADLQARASR